MIKRGIFKANDIRGITEGSDPEWDLSDATTQHERARLRLGRCY
jgi:hypothetical protein